VVARLDDFTLLLVIGGMGFGVANHLVDLFLGETRGSGDADGLLLAGPQILGGDVDDAVCVDVEGHLDLWHAAGRRRDAGQLEVAEGLVVRSHVALTLEDVDGNRGLVVGRGGEYLALAAGDGGVLVDKLGHNPAQGLDAQGERGNVQEEDILHVAAEHAALDCRADGHHFVRVDAPVRRLAEDILNLLLHDGHAGHAAHQDNLVNLAGGKSGVLEGRPAGAFQAVDEIRAQGFKLCPGKLQGQMFRAGGVGCDERQVDIGLQGGGEFALGLFGRLFEPLQGHLVGAKVDSLVFLEFVGYPVDDLLVEILAAQEGVPVGGFYLEYAFAQFQDGDVEGAAAQVEHGDLFVLLLVQAVGEGGRSRLVDDAQDVKSGNLAGVLGGLPLGIVEVGRNRDDRVGHGLTQIVLGGLLHFLQHHGGDFRRRILLAANLYPCVAVIRLDDLEW